MAQVMQVNSMVVQPSMDKRNYSVNVKGLMIHLLDILFGKGEVKSNYYSSELSAHMQHDLGINR